MKKKALVILLCASALSLTGCGKSDKTESRTMTDKEVSAAIESAVNKNNETLKSEIEKELLSKVNKTIDEKLETATALTTEEKNALKESIMVSLENDIIPQIEAAKNQETSQQIVRNVTEEYPTYYTSEEYITNEYPSNEYITNEYTEEITNVTEEHNQYITNEVVDNKPPQIEDGTAIPFTFELPYTYTDENGVQCRIDTIELTAWNYEENTPYAGSSYAYKIKVHAIGVFILPDDYEENTPTKLVAPSFIMQPYDTKITGGTMGINGTPDITEREFEYNVSMATNMVPEQITIY